MVAIFSTPLSGTAEKGIYTKLESDWRNKSSSGSFERRHSCSSTNIIDEFKLTNKG